MSNNNVLLKAKQKELKFLRDINDELNNLIDFYNNYPSIKNNNPILDTISQDRKRNKIIAAGYQSQLEVINKRISDLENEIQNLKS